MFGVGDEGAGAVCGVCSGLAVKTPWRHHWRRASVFKIDCARVCSGVSVFDFGQVNAGWVLAILMKRFLLTNDISD